MYPEIEFEVNVTFVALGKPVPTLLPTRTARPAPFCITLREIVRPLTPSSKRMSDDATLVESWNVLSAIDEFVRLKA